MKTKTLTIILGMIFLVGIITAGTITNVSTSLEIPSFIAGGTTSTTFSFDYPDSDDNYNNAPLVARVNLTGVNETPSVWKGDFNLFMYAEQYLLPEFFKYNTIPMTCSETAPIQFKAKDKYNIQYTINEVPNGTFYCYNPNYYMLQLDSRDKVNLSISSNLALYPGEYNVSIELMEMEPDNAGPKIELVSSFDNTTFSENKTIVPIELNITDMYNINDETVKYKIVTADLPSDGVGLNASYYDSGWIYEIEYNESSGLYEHDFDIEKYGLNESGFYWIYAEAKDVIGNNGKL
jgi:hypothetical protein